MRVYTCRKKMVRYRFKDRMDCVFFREFHTDREARMWYERNKVDYMLKELCYISSTY